MDHNYSSLLNNYKDKILNGRKLSIKLKNLLSTEVKRIKTNDSKAVISLKIFLFNEDKASEFYVHQIIKLCETIGIQTLIKVYDSIITQEELEKEIMNSNDDKTIHGILISFPVPKHINYFNLINKLDNIKDIDGLGDKNKEIFKKCSKECTQCMQSPTALSALELIRLALLYNNNIEEFFKDYYYNNLHLSENLLDLSAYDISVVGKGVSAGKPTIDLVEKCGGNVRSFNSRSGDYRGESKKSDIVISAVGRKSHIINEEFIKENQIVIDSSIISMIVDGKEVITGDVNTESVITKVKYISPVPGGVGSLTVIMLIKNLLKAYLILTCGKIKSESANENSDIIIKCDLNEDLRLYGDDNNVVCVEKAGKKIGKGESSI